MSERFVSGVSAKIALYKYSSFPFLSLGYILNADNMALAAVNLTQLTPKRNLPYCVKQRVMTVGGSFKVTQGHRFWYRSKARMRLPICGHSTI